MENIFNNENLINILKQGGIAVMPTDTVYGIVARAEDEIAVDKVYRVRQRNPDKPCIILIANIEELQKFSINLTQTQRENLKQFWPGPVSIIFACEDDRFSYLHRGTETLAFRIPGNEGLRDMLAKTGPLIAPSANPEGKPTATNIKEANEYFGYLVNFYLDGGDIAGSPSKLIKLEKNDTFTTLRE